MDIKKIDTRSMLSVKEFLNFMTRTKKDSENVFTQDFIILNLDRILADLYSTKGNFYSLKHSHDLLKVNMCLADHCKGKGEDIYKLIENGRFFFIYTELIKYHINQPKFDYSSLNVILETMNRLIAGSDHYYKESFKINRIVKATVDQGILKLLHDILVKENFLERPYNEFPLKYVTYSTILSIFLHCSKDRHLIKNELVKFNMINTLLGYLQNSLHRVSLKEYGYLYLTIMCILKILANILTDSEMNLCAEMVFDTLYTCLCIIIKKAETNKKVLNSKYYISYSITSNETYVTADELINILTKISTGERVQQIIFEKNIFEQIEILINQGSPNDKEACLNLICSLCFNSQMIKYLTKTNTNLLATIESIRKRTNSREVPVKTICDQIKVMANQVTRKQLFKRMRSIENLIVISNCQKFYLKCERIRNELKKIGFNVYMSVDGSTESLRGDMDKHIETASLVLICFSDEYKNNIFCRYDAKQVTSFEKDAVFVKMDNNEPHGWLQKVVSNNPCVDYTIEDESLAFKNLLEQIEENLGTIDELFPDYQSKKACVENPESVVNPIELAPNPNEPKLVERTSMKMSPTKTNVDPIVRQPNPNEPELVERTSIKMSPTKTNVDPIVRQPNPNEPKLVERTSIKMSTTKTNVDPIVRQPNPNEPELVERTSIKMSPTKTNVDPIVRQPNPNEPELVERTSIKMSTTKTNVDPIVRQPNLIGNFPNLMENLLLLKQKSIENQIKSGNTIRSLIDLKLSQIPLKQALIEEKYKLYREKYQTKSAVDPAKTKIDPKNIQTNPIRPSLIPVESELVEGTSVQKSTKNTGAQTAEPETIEIKKKIEYTRNNLDRCYLNLKQIKKKLKFFR